VSYTLPEESGGASCMISNMEHTYDQAEITVKPYEAFVLHVK